MTTKWNNISTMNTTTTRTLSQPCLQFMTNIQHNRGPWLITFHMSDDLELTEEPFPIAITFDTITATRCNTVTITTRHEHYHDHNYGYDKWHYHDAAVARGTLVFSRNDRTFAITFTTPTLPELGPRPRPGRGGARVGIRQAPSD